MLIRYSVPAFSSRPGLAYNLTFQSAPGVVTVAVALDPSPVISAAAPLFASSSKELSVVLPPFTVG